MCVFFLLSSPHRLSSVSVVFDFSALLSDVVPVSLILHSIVTKRIELMFVCKYYNGFCMLYSPLRSSLVSVVFDFNETLSAIAPMSSILLSVDVKRKEKSELLMDVFFCVSSFFCLHDIV